jgi:hypothetical protein
MPAIAKGTKVWANIGGKTDYIGFVNSEPYENAQGETKYKVQIGDGIRELGYREPKDDDAAGKGVTFWLA